MIKRKGLPSVNEIVLCTVRRVTPYAAWCTLDEYENLEGMVHISEVAGKWVHDIREFAKVDKQYVTKVVRIDSERNIINLSMKRVSERDKKEKLNSYRKAQRAEKFLEQAAQALGKNLQQAYDEIGYLLQEKFGELYVAMEEIKNGDKQITKLLPKQWLDALSVIIAKTLKEKEIAIKVELELRSYSGNGIEIIKNALSSLQKSKASVKYISAPKYRVELKTIDPKHDEKKMRECLESAINAVKQSHGDGSYKFVK